MSRQKNVVNGPSWRIEWRRFNKQQAGEALAKVRRDRPLDEAWVDALARSMDLGLWETYRPSQVPVMFDRDGYRLNGKHRLAAFIRSKLEDIVFPVAVNCRPEDYDTTDQDGKRRTKKSAHPDVKFVTREQARILWLQKVQAGDLALKITEPEFQFLHSKTWRRETEWASDVLGKASEQGRAMYAAALMYVHKADAEFADRIAKGWVNGGAGLPAPLLRFRDEAIRDRTATGNNRGYAMRKTFKMLNALAAMHQGKEVPARLTEALGGLRYFSEQIRDGAANRWQKRSLVSEE